MLPPWLDVEVFVVLVVFLVVLAVLPWAPRICFSRSSIASPPGDGDELDAFVLVACGHVTSPTNLVPNPGWAAISGYTLCIDRTQPGPES